MFKLFEKVVLSALFAVVLARPGLYESAVYSAPAYASVAVQEHGYAQVGSIVKSVPSAVSHQSHSVVHSSAHVVEDVLAPAVKSTLYSTKSLVAPLVETYAAAPTYVKSYAAPSVVYKSYAEAAPVLYKSW
ncbi:retinin-like [Calliphora vicina]|uniref:retinin-like n=1 Tax=Calliphora vicina TaxID=7373 RepID=UPI00325AAB79